jgi:hypothetical protein
MREEEMTKANILKAEPADKYEQLYCATVGWLEIVQMVRRRRDIWKAIALISIFVNAFLLLCLTR